MRKQRPVSYNPSQALILIATDRDGTPLKCPACGDETILREPDVSPPPPRSHVTLRCAKCKRVAKYIAGTTATS